MIAWLAGRCDGADYGHLLEYEFSKDQLFYGPYQIQARINQNPEISQQYSLWNQMGSKVLLGNLLVIPIEDSLLYIEPLYIRAQDGQLPELKRVIASYDNRTVMGDDLESTLAALFKEPAGHAPVIAKTETVQPTTGNPAPSTDKVRTGTPDLRGASAHYTRALADLKSGDWAGFGAEMQKLGEELQQSPPP
jgi:uncharacterized membrane protein (UPF0182 family)